MDMTESQTTEDKATQTTETKPIRTQSDLVLEELSRRLDTLEAENRELREANKGLWAAAHPAQPAQDPQTAQPAQTVHPDEGADVKTVYEKFGVI